MISKESLSLEWIESRVNEFKGSDPIIVEKVIRALVLLESLKSNGLQFIFKGGTALMLMVQEPRRFSIDIDIIVEDKDQDIEAILNTVVENTDFTGWEQQERQNKSKIDKRHYELQYKPQATMQGDTNYILLDIVFEENPYTATESIEVSHFLLIEEGKPIKVTVPTLSAILGDKLTAYAPSTTGIPISKPMEMMKQVYDIGGIFDRLENLDGVRENFIKVARQELEYRGFANDQFQLIINDILSSSHNFCIQGKLETKLFKTMLTGTNKLNNFIYGDKFREPQAQICLAKTSYMAKLIELDLTAFQKYDQDNDMSSWKIKLEDFLRLNRLKKHNTEAFHYWYKTIQLLG
jgi:hypothetical protein